MIQFMITKYQEHLLGQRPTSCRGGERPHGLLDWIGCTGQEVRAAETGNGMISIVWVSNIFYQPYTYIFRYRKKQTNMQSMFQLLETPQVKKIKTHIDQPLPIIQYNVVQYIFILFWEAVKTYKQLPKRTSCDPQRPFNCMSQTYKTFLPVAHDPCANSRTLIWGCGTAETMCWDIFNRV